MSIERCADCDKLVDVELPDGSYVEGELVCYECQENREIESAGEERDRRLDDPRRGQAKGLN